ncbi:alpha/beta hydrolase [Actinomadura viridis]|uniref:Acetyl esterase/lipase n=1 Tax=Actinomadura viridis TaxID=58110 RepID=A0A931GL79_9ACTN|nr:alpha/beta hydrolase fold domain-containing protein [Actinomadura viridis]MBG6087186.1 acetyl esterase/lipase [Actinomadura viridis]
MTIGTGTPPIRPVARTAAERRIARELALEPGGPPSLRARLTGRAVRALVKTAWSSVPDSADGLIRFQRLSGLVSRAQTVPPGVAIAREDLGTCSAEWVRAGAPDERKVFLYLHGGAYFFGSARLYRPSNWRLSASTGRPVLALDYRLAPHYGPSDALDDALTAYGFLLESGYAPGDIVVGGDSAGGHLALALLLELRRRGTGLPAAAVCLSPWVDLRCASDSHRLNARSEAVIPAGKLAWLGRVFTAGKGAAHPLLAPRHGDLAGLPPLLLVASGSEILRDEVRDLAERAQTAGVGAVYQEWDGLMHVFTVFADFVPEGKAAFRHIAEFLRRTGA